MDNDTPHSGTHPLPTPSHRAAQASTGKDSRWNLSSLELTNVASGVKGKFEYRDWVGVDSGPVTIKKILPARDYKVRGRGGGSYQRVTR